MKKFVKVCLVGGVAAFCGCTEVEVPEQSLEDQFVSMICEYESPAELPVMKWESKSDYKIVFSSDKFVSFKITKWTYSGGAHGMTVTKVGTVRNGKVMKLADLPSDIPQLWKNAMVKHFKEKSFEQLIIKRDTFKPYITENFYLDSNGVHFIYDPYEIDCFAAGTIDIFVPYTFGK